jgi:hypothetical protein
MEFDELVTNTDNIINYIKFLHKVYENDDAYIEVYRIKKIFEREIKKTTGLLREEYKYAKCVCEDYLINVIM